MRESVMKSLSEKLIFVLVGLTSFVHQIQGSGKKILLGCGSGLYCVFGWIAGHFEGSSLNLAGFFAQLYRHEKKDRGFVA